MSAHAGNKASISFPYLRRFNGIMSGVHLVQAVLMLVAGLSIASISRFRLPLTSSFLSYDVASQRLVSLARDLGGLQIAPMVSAFLFLSALFHLLTILPGLNGVYNRHIEKGINPFRWFEYALSSSVMIVLIAMLFGVYDLASLIMIFALNATMNLMGLMMELHNQDAPRTRWTAFVIGCFSGAVPWAVVLMYFLGGGNFSRIPWFVYAIFGTYFVFFNLFPVNMVLQYRKAGRWADYRYGERGYILLSLVAKSVLAWLVFFGTFQPS
jgi:hypothetical protein